MKWYLEDDVVMLLKTLKKEYLESTLDGKLCFSCPNMFTSKTNGLKPGQQDDWDSHISVDAQYMVAAPIISKKTEPIQYGQGQKLADKVRIHFQDENARYSPINCFRKITKGDLLQREDCHVFALGDLVDKSHP